MTDRPLETLTNLGKISARQLGEIGIASETQLRDVGAVAAYLRLKDHFGRAVSLNYLYALGGALKDLRWEEMPESDRAALRAEASAMLGGKRNAGAGKGKKRGS